MDFGTPYRLYMREHAPQLYADLSRAGDLDRTINEGARAASADLAAMIEDDQLVGDPAGIQAAREVVLFRLLSTLDPYLSPDRQPDPEGVRQWEALLSGQRVLDVGAAADAASPHAVSPSALPAPRRGGAGFAAGVLAGAALVAGAWIAPRQTAEVVTALYGPLATAAEGAIVVGLFILAPAAFIPRLKPLARHGLRYAAWVLAAALWVTAWATTYLHFGRGAATIGMVLFGGPILPMGLIAALGARDWWTSVSLVMLFTGWLAAWITSAAMVHQADLRDVRAAMLRQAT